MTLQPGTQLGSYQIVLQIGVGGMGEVYRAHDPKLGRDVAIKLLPKAFAEDSDRLRRFQVEARTLAALSHPNVVQVHDAGEHEGNHYLVMELLEGQTLRQLLEKGRMPWRKAVELAAATADGLAAAHAKGIVHRDLKPENLILTEHGLKILDFGLAKQRLPTPGERATVALSKVADVDTPQPGTLDGALMGTVGYMAPEQVQGLPADARSDIFALGCVLYELVTGNRAFARNSAVETLAAIIREPVPETSLSGSGGTPELDRILNHCLEKAPGERFHSAKDLAFALHTLLGSAPAGAAVPPVPGKARPWRILAVAASLAVAALIALLLWSPWKHTPPAFDPHVVAVASFENRTGDPSMDSLGQQIVDIVRQDLQRVDNLQVAGDPDLPIGANQTRRLAAATRARVVATGAYYLRGGEVEFQAKVVDPWAGKVVYSLGPWRGSREDPANALAELRQVLGGALAWTLDDKGRNEMDGLNPPRLGAYFLFKKGAEGFGWDEVAATDAYEKSLGLDPNFFWARFYLSFSLEHLGRWEDAGALISQTEMEVDRLTAVERLVLRWMRGVVDGRYEEILTTFKAIKAIQPETEFIRFNRGVWELTANRPGSSIRSLSGVSSRYFQGRTHNDWWPGRWLCNALHQAGDYEGQLRVAKEGQANFSDVMNFRAAELEALAALGRLAEFSSALQALPTGASRPGFIAMSRSDTLLDAVMELRTHGHKEESQRLAAQSLTDLQTQGPAIQKQSRLLIATLLIHLDRGAEALDVLKGLSAENLKDVDLQGKIGALLARLGRSADAGKADADLAAITRPYLFGKPTFWRACIAAQRGDKDRAVALLGQAFGQGMRYGTAIHKELFLEPMHGYPPYEALMKPKD